MLLLLWVLAVAVVLVVLKRGLESGSSCNVLLGSIVDGKGSCCCCLSLARAVLVRAGPNKDFKTSGEGCCCCCEARDIADPAGLAALIELPVVVFRLLLDDS